MLLVDNVNGKDFLALLFNAIYEELPKPKKENRKLTEGKWRSC